MSGPLAELGVLVTRPKDQAEPLCRLIEAAGGRALKLPGLVIAPATDSAAARRLLAADSDLLIFISRNAVDYALPLFPAGRLPASAGVAAVGRATARALSAAGRTPDLIPERRYDSEGLLELPALQRLSDKRVLIVRGNGGRSLLGDTLRARGARVRYVEVYRRDPPAIDVEPWLGLLRDDVHLITATSAEILCNLYRVFGERGRPLLLDRPLVVVSARIAATADELGFRRTRVATGADDQAIVAALSELAGQEANS